MEKSPITIDMSKGFSTLPPTSKIDVRLRHSRIPRLNTTFSISDISKQDKALTGRRLREFSIWHADCHCIWWGTRKARGIQDEIPKLSETLFDESPNAQPFVPEIPLERVPLITEMIHEFEWRCRSPKETNLNSRRRQPAVKDYKDGSILMDQICFAFLKMHPARSRLNSTRQRAD
jgi:hypothetical protein